MPRPLSTFSLTLCYCWASATGKVWLQLFVRANKGGKAVALGQMFLFVQLITMTLFSAEAQVYLCRERSELSGWRDSWCLSPLIADKNQKMKRNKRSNTNSYGVVLQKRQILILLLGDRVRVGFYSMMYCTNLQVTKSNDHWLNSIRIHYVCYGWSAIEFCSHLYEPIIRTYHDNSFISQ